MQRREFSVVLVLAMMGLGGRRVVLGQEAGGGSAEDCFGKPRGMGGGADGLDDRVTVGK